MFVQARSKMIKDDLMANNKVKDFSERHINALAETAVINTIQSANNKDPKKRKFIEIEVSESDDSSDE